MLGSEAAPLGEIAAGTKSKDTVGIAAVKDLAFGSAGGMIGKVFEYPFDTVKVSFSPFIIQFVKKNPSLTSSPLLPPPGPSPIPTQ